MVLLKKYWVINVWSWHKQNHDNNKKKSRMAISIFILDNHIRTLNPSWSLSLCHIFYIATGLQVQVENWVLHKSQVWILHKILLQVQRALQVAAGHQSSAGDRSRPPYLLVWYIKTLTFEPPWETLVLTLLSNWCGSPGIPQLTTVEV